MDKRGEGPTLGGLPHRVCGMCGAVGVLHGRLHSALYFLRPVDYYRGDPEKLLEERRRKLAEARQRRQQHNLAIRQERLASEAVDREVKYNPISTPVCATC